MKNMHHICTAAFTTFLVTLLLCSCGAKRISADTIQMTDSDELVRGVSEMQTTYCINDFGMLYPSNSTIKYYDFATDTSYILCDKANCRHENDKCSAWYEDHTFLRGLALYQNHCYMFRYQIDDNSWELIQTDLTGSDRKTIARLDGGSQDGDGGWLLASVNEAYYIGDIVWYSADYTYADKAGVTAGCRQYGGINLTDGSQTILNELTLDDIQFELEAITKKYIVLMKRSSEMELLSKSAFEEERKNGTFGTLFDDSEDPYYDYYRKWRPYHCNMTDTYLRYSIETGEFSVLDTLPTSFHTDEEGAVWQFNIQYSFNGEYDGKLLCNQTNWNNTEDPLNECDLFLWNIENNTRTDVKSWHGGLALYGGDGEYSPNIYNNSKFLYVTYEGNTGPLDYFEYDLKTGESSPKLFDLMYGGDFHVLGETPDLFIARKYTEVMGVPTYEAYKISKEDFYAGKLDKAVKLKL